MTVSECLEHYVETGTVDFYGYDASGNNCDARVIVDGLGMLHFETPTKEIDDIEWYPF